MFDREIEETVEIVASPSEVWWHLTNFEAYPRWNPFITKIEGEVREGARLSVTIDPDGIPPVVFRPKILVAEPERELRWRGRPGLPNLFDGEHVFVIESLGLKRLRLTQRELFGGLLVPGTMPLIGRAVRRGFRDMNQALRQRAEASHATREAARAQERASS